MDLKTKINTAISIVLVTLITALAFWAQLPAKDLKAQLISTNTVLVRIQDFAFDPDVVRIEPETTVSWLHDESEANADVQHSVSSYDPSDSSAKGKEFESSLMSLGDTFSFTFNEPGVYYYSCSLYPFMTGKICVGLESETADKDCSRDVATTTTATEPTEPTEPAEPEEPAAPEEPEDDFDFALNEEDEDAEDDDLFPAADEDFEVSVVDYSSGTATVTTVATGTATADGTSEAALVDTQLTDSGPEYIIYLFAAFFALFMGSKLARNQA